MQIVLFLCIRLVDKRVIFISHSLWYRHCVVEAGKEFLNHTIEKEGRVNSCDCVTEKKELLSNSNLQAERGCTPT